MRPTRSDLEKVRDAYNAWTEEEELSEEEKLPYECQYGLFLFLCAHFQKPPHQSGEVEEQEREDGASAADLTRELLDAIRGHGSLVELVANGTIYAKIKCGSDGWNARWFRLPFGKYKGLPLQEIPLIYLDQTISVMPDQWIVRRVRAFVDYAMRILPQYEVPRGSLIDEAKEHEIDLRDIQ